MEFYKYEKEYKCTTFLKFYQSGKDEGHKSGQVVGRLIITANASTRSFDIDLSIGDDHNGLTQITKMSSYQQITRDNYAVLSRYANTIANHVMFDSSKITEITIFIVDQFNFLIKEVESNGFDIKGSY